MTTPFAHIQTRHEPSTEPNESKVALVATLSIEANSDQTIDAYLGGLQMYNDLFEWRLDEYPQKALDLIIDCFLPAESVPQSILKNGVSVGLTRSRVFQSGDWISGKQWLQLASTSTPGGEVDPNRLLADGQIFSLRPGKVDFSPCMLWTVATAIDRSAGFATYCPFSRLAWTSGLWRLGSNQKIRPWAVSLPRPCCYPPQNGC